MTAAAQKFIDDINVGWDFAEPWLDTAILGLAEVDEDLLREYCEESGEPYQTAERESLDYICSVARSIQP